MTTTCCSLIEDAIQDFEVILTALTSSPGSWTLSKQTLKARFQHRWRRARAPRQRISTSQSKIRCLRSTNQGLKGRKESHGRGLRPRAPQSEPEHHRKPPRNELKARRNYKELLQKYWKDDLCEPAADLARRILEWSENTMESVIETLSREQADETCNDRDLEFNLPWNSPVVTGPIIVRDQLQDRLSPLEKQLADLRWRQNTLIPIARVLPEILIEIFELVLGAAEVHYFERDDTNLLLAVLMRICRDWTRLVFNKPRLWSRVSPRRSAIKHVAVALARSKSFPLSVHYDVWKIPHIRPRHFFGLIKGHAERSKVLDLYLSPSESVDALNPIFAKVFPLRLETLRIQLVDNGSAATWPEISFFKEPWHEILQHLCLHRVRLPPGGYGELRGLKTLTLTGDLGQIILNTAEILRALSNSPELESLCVISLSGLGGELNIIGTANLMRPVRLDRLREIHLRLPAASLRAFSRSILPTKLIHVSLETTMQQENQLAWTEVLLTEEIQPCVRVIESTLHSTRAISFSVTSPKLSLQTRPKDNVYSATYVHLVFTGDRIAEVGKWMAKSLDLGSAEVTVDIEDKSALWIDTTPFILSKFHNTVGLHIDKTAESVSQVAIDFLSTLLYTDSAGSQHFPFPRLTGLTLKVHEPSGAISMLARRYIQHGSTDVTSIRYPVALSNLCLQTYTEPSAPDRRVVKRSDSMLPGCVVWVVPPARD